jgi:hypothetical protein
MGNMVPTTTMLLTTPKFCSQQVRATMTSLDTNKRNADQLEQDSVSQGSDEQHFQYDLNKKSKPNEAFPNTGPDSILPDGDAPMEDVRASDPSTLAETPPPTAVDRTAAVSQSPDSLQLSRQELRKLADKYVHIYYDDACSYPDPSTVRANLKRFPDRAHGVLAEDFCCKYERQNA